jgi:hypothetical protein
MDIQTVFGNINIHKRLCTHVVDDSHPYKMRVQRPWQAFGLSMKKPARRASLLHGLDVSEGYRAIAPKPTVCGVADNSPAANRASCRGKRVAFPTATPLAHSLHSPFYFLTP